MKIVQIVNSLSAGGAERLVLDLHSQYLAMGHDSYVIGLSGKRALSGDDGLWCTGCSSPYHYSIASRLKVLFRSEPFADAEIVHVHLFPALLRVPPALMRTGWNGVLIASEHSTSNRRRKALWGSFADNYTYRYYRKIVCVSGAVKESLVSWKPALSPKTVVIPNGARLSLFKPPERTSFHNPPVVLSVGRLVPAKNYETALRAVSLLSGGDRPFIKWLIAGDGSLREELEQRSKNLSLEEVVTFLGSRDDIPDLMRKADIFLIPSLWEGFGIAAVEAMASGLPLIAGDVPGLREIAGINTGLLVNPSSVEEISRALSALLEDEAAALKKGANGPTEAAGYSLETCAQKHTSLFQAELQSTF